MGSTRRDLSGVFAAEIGSQKVVKAAVLNQSFRLNRNGLSFFSNEPLTEWTELGVELQLPHTPSAATRAVRCRAVVVQCERRAHGRGYKVALWFVNLPKRAQAELEVLPPALQPLNVAIAR